MMDILRGHAPRITPQDFAPSAIVGAPRQARRAARRAAKALPPTPAPTPAAQPAPLPAPWVSALESVAPPSTRCARLEAQLAESKWVEAQLEARLDGVRLASALTSSPPGQATPAHLAFETPARTQEQRLRQPEQRAPAEAQVEARPSVHHSHHDPHEDPYSFVERRSSFAQGEEDRQTFALPGLRKQAKSPSRQQAALGGGDSRGAPHPASALTGVDQHPLGVARGCAHPQKNGSTASGRGKWRLFGRRATTPSPLDLA
jgi:hypothetical protein